MHNSHNQLAVYVEEAKGLEKIFALQHHSNSQIYDKAMSMLERFFEAVDEDANLAPETQGQHLVFGMAQGGQQPTFSFPQ